MCIKHLNEVNKELKKGKPHPRTRTRRVKTSPLPKNVPNHCHKRSQEYLKNDTNLSLNQDETEVVIGSPGAMSPAPNSTVAPAIPKDIEPVKRINQDSTINTFIAVMIHANACKSCTQLSCRKMRVVLQHHATCKRSGEMMPCKVCDQLLTIVEKHATHLCQAGTEHCPVPLCNSIRKSIQIQKMKNEIEDQIEAGIMEE